jgi:hypothetical protein
MIFPAGVLACVLTAGALAEAGQRTATRSTATPPRQNVQGFSVVLVMGDLGAAAAMPETVPPAARKALADMKDFLPYKSYKLLDTSWILSDNSSAHATGRLKGPDDSDYQLALEASPENPAGSTLRVSFSLLDPRRLDLIHRPASTSGRSSGPARGESETPSLDYMRSEMALAELRKRAIEMQKMIEAQKEAGQNPGARRSIPPEKLEELPFIIEGGRIRVGGQPLKVIETGFTMDVGETVVVGTSRVGGDKAIIVLLTAVPRGGRR